MNPWLLIPFFIILIVIFPIVLEVRISYNLLENRGVVALFFYKIKLFYYNVEFHGKYITLSNDLETKKIKLELVSPQFAVIEEFMKQVKNKIKLKYIFVYYNIGLGDSFQTAMLCGAINQILNFVFVRLKSSKPTASLAVYDTVSFNREIFEFATRGKFSISLFDLVYSFVYSYIILKV